MDANKLKKLREIKYTIKHVCFTCTHFQGNHIQWSTCAYHTYKHLKHTVAERQLSVYALGSCAQWAKDENFNPVDATWKEFVEG